LCSEWAGRRYHGRVRDDTNEPGGIQRDSFKASNNGERQFLSPTDSATTDDRGEYRFFWIPTGRYYVLVSRPRQGFYPESEESLPTKPHHPPFIRV
jgi:hypothetical protein